MLPCASQVARDWDELSKAEVIPELRGAEAAAEVSWMQPVNKQYCVGHWCTARGGLSPHFHIGRPAVAGRCRHECVAYLLDLPEERSGLVQRHA